MPDRPEINEDFADMLLCLQRSSVEFLVVGAHALAAHGIARATGDIDIFVRPSPDNAVRVVQALVDFGAPIAAHSIGTHDFTVPGTVFPSSRLALLEPLASKTSALVGFGRRGQRSRVESA